MEKQNEINLHATTDALVWASEFLNVIKKEGIHLLLDKDWLHTWFANAIMTGCDHTASAKNKQYIYILKSHTGELVKIFDYEPDDADMDEAYAKYLYKTGDLAPGTASMNCVLYRWCKFMNVGKTIPLKYGTEKILMYQSTTGNNI